MHTIDWEAKASLSSMRSRSSTPMPARSSALRVAGTGPKPMTAGSTPATAVDTTRASGLRPRARARSASTSRTADGAVVDARAVAGRDGAALAERRPELRRAPRRMVSARGCSSRSTTIGSPFAGRPRPARSGRRSGRPRWPRRRAAGCASANASWRSRLDAPALGDVLGGLAHRVRVVERRPASG